MYKSKLQELCHQKSLDLPEYTTAKHGLDHNPRFQSTVTVNGQTFSSGELCTSSKQAQNDAARVAFEHFSSPSLPRPSLSALPAPPSDGSSSGSTVEINERETNRNTQVNTAISTVHDVYRSGGLDMRHLCKNQLQHYAQKNNLPLPVYSCEREGPSHACRFKCKVTIDGHTYESQHSFLTLREAENETAKLALMSLSPDKLQQDNSVLYKNLLQELAQKEGYSLPVYNTKHSGESHIPTFISTVEVEREVFSGQEAKTKKQAEMNAAKVAYMKFKERLGNPSQSPAFVSPAVEAQAEYSSSSLQSELAQGQHLSPSSIPKGEAEENKELVTTVKAEVGGVDLSHFPQPELSCSSELSIAENVMLPSSLPAECSFSPVVDSSGDSVGTKASTRRVIRVRPNVANMKLPDGSSVLHRDSKWVAWEERS